jgi:hypothetical protein
MPELGLNLTYPPYSHQLLMNAQISIQSELDIVHQFWQSKESICF